jgi:hypothetical protein
MMKKMMILTVMLTSVVVMDFAQTTISGQYAVNIMEYLNFTSKTFYGQMFCLDATNHCVFDTVGGTYSVSGNTLTLNITDGKFIGQTLNFTIDDANTISDTMLPERRIWRKPGTGINEFGINGTELTGYNGQSRNVTIPESVNFIGNYVFYRRNITSITIPDSVTTIGNAAFSFNRLTSVTIPNSVTSIGYSAFSNNQLTSVTIPNSVTSIGEWTFSNNQLTSVNIPDSVKTIESGAFSSNEITSVTIPNSVTAIEDFAFISNQLTSVTIPNSVTSIGLAVFSINKLTRVTIGADVMIGRYAFGDTGFNEFYERNGKKAGEYTYDENQKTWSYKK